MTIDEARALAQGWDESGTFDIEDIDCRLWWDSLDAMLRDAGTGLSIQDVWATREWEWEYAPLLDEVLRLCEAGKE